MTKEEIEKMANLFIAVMKNEIPDNYIKIVKSAYLKGFEYSDQQTKELQQRVEELNASLLDVATKSANKVVELQAKIDELENGNKLLITAIKQMNHGINFLHNKFEKQAQESFDIATETIKNYNQLTSKKK